MSAGVPPVSGRRVTEIAEPEEVLKPAQITERVDRMERVADPRTACGAQRRSVAAQHVPPSTAAAPTRPVPVRPRANEPYTPPPGTEVLRKSWGEIIGRIFLTILMAPIYLACALVAALPALVGGIVSAPRADEANGDGTFYGGFTKVFRSIMNTVFIWINSPMTHNIERMNMERVRGTFMLDRRDSNRIQITVRVHLTGNPQDVALMREREPMIEHFMTNAPYFVNVEFIDSPDAYSITIPIDRSVWPNSQTWNPFNSDNVVDVRDAHTAAHELMHQLGLPDEYDMPTHFTNPHLDGWGRFGTFLAALLQVPPPVDQAQSLMGAGLRPLRRNWERVVRDAT